MAQRVPATQIVAFRGWLKDGTDDVRTALKNAQESGCWGSGAGLRMTADSTLALSGAVLDEYLAQGEKNRDCRLLLELDPAGTEGREKLFVGKCLDALQAHRLLDPKRVGFLSASLPLCRELAQAAPGFSVSYRGDDLTPAVLHAEGINGIACDYGVLERHPDWVRQARDLGVSVQVRSVDDDEAAIRKMRDAGVDRIATDHPDRVREILWENCR